MAITRSGRTTKVTLNVETATDTFKNRIFNNVNPAVVDTKIGELFGLSKDTSGTLAAMQSYAINRLIRTDTADLIEE